MAGGGKVAVATLMFALLLSSSLVQAARPIVAEGSNIAVDGTLVARDAHSRQLKTLFFGWPFGGCWLWWHCRLRPVVFTRPGRIDYDDDKRRHSRKLHTLPWWWYGYGHGYGGFWGRFGGRFGWPWW